MKRLVVIAILALAASSPASGQLDDKCVLAECTECTCYWSSDCGSGQYCSYSSGCTHVGKKDGTCKSSGSGGVTPDQFTTASTALGLWFDAYQDTAPDKGLPNVEIVKRIGALNLTAENSRRVRFAAFNALDVVLGFDFAHPRGDCEEYDARCLGIFRIPPTDPAKRLLQAVKSGFAQGFQNRDRAAFEKTVPSFWKKHRRFRPHHTGRCYPHGHREHPYKSVAQCQLEELTRILEDLLTAPQK